MSQPVDFENLVERGLIVSYPASRKPGESKAARLRTCGSSASFTELYLAYPEIPPTVSADSLPTRDGFVTVIPSKIIS